MYYNQENMGYVVVLFYKNPSYFQPFLVLFCPINKLERDFPSLEFINQFRRDLSRIVIIESIKKRYRQMDRYSFEMEVFVGFSGHD